MARRVSVVFALSAMWLLASLAAGCGERAADTSLRTGSPCSPPCWHNLVPGESGEEDVRRELESSPFVRAGTLQSWGESGEASQVYGWTSQRGKSNWIRLRDGKIQRIEIRPDFDLTIGEVISLFGPSEGVYAYVEGSERYVYRLILDYPTRELEFLSDADGRYLSLQDRTGTIQEKQSATVVYYYAPQPLESALREVFGCYPAYIEAMLRDEQSWPGIGGTISLSEYGRP